MKKYLIMAIAFFVICQARPQSDIALLNRKVRDFSEKPEKNAHLPYKTIPFQLVKGKILVAAEIDGNKGFLILDTGAPGIVINKKTSKQQAVQAFSVSREMVVHETTIQHMIWGGFEKTSVKAMALDLSHLEESLQQNILGLIGYEALKDLNLIINFSERQILLSSKKQKNFTDSFIPKYQLSFDIENHLPVVTLEVEGKALRFGIDTGSGGNLIDQKWAEKELKAYFSKDDTEQIRGLDQQIDEVQSGYLKLQSKKGNFFAEQKFLTLDLTPLRTSTELSIDGILGYPFFSSYICHIDFENKRITMW